ncbi:MAG TPA: glutaredoxin domain-containing protein [bacterium]|nr:glutaredoxin domain-containing protein [bacterium]
MKQKEVTVFSTPSCPWCSTVKIYLEEKGVKFTDYDVSRDHERAKKMISRSGSMGVPQLWIGDEVIVGFDQAKIDQLLG